MDGNPVKGVGIMEWEAKQTNEDPPIMDVLTEALEKHPRIMGIILGIVLHPMLSAILINR